MENASKALLMAGGILISMLVITVAVVLINTYSQLGVTYQDKMVEIEIQKFNSNFTKFEGREDITIHEIVSIVNFTKKYNEQTEMDINTILSGEGDLMNLSDEEIVELIKVNSDKKYQCTNVSIGDNDGKIDSISFQESV